MNDQINTLFSDSYNQKQFFKNSILNSVIIYRYIIKDYFKYFLSSLSPLSRYEFWCFIFSLFISTVILSSLLFFVYTLFPAAKLFADIIFYSYVFFAFNVSVRAFACRIISVQQYLSNIKNNTQKAWTANVESSLKIFFINVKTYYIIIYINIFIVLVSIYFHFFNNNLIYNLVLHHQIILNIIHFICFILNTSALMYIILLLLPSVNNFEFCIDKHIKYYQIRNHYNKFLKYYIIDYFTLAAGVSAIISVGYLLIVGFDLTCHLIVCVALLLQSAGLIFSGRYFSIIIGIISLIYLIVMSILLVENYTPVMFYDSNIVMHTLNYYQMAIALCFIGVFYHIIFYKDILKMSAVLGFYLAALFLWEDHIAITNIAVYDNHTIPVLFYGLVEIITFFMYLVRVANNKGWYMSETQILNGWHHINKVTLKNISIVIFYACVAFAAYSFVTLLYYSLHNILNIAIVDGYFINFSHNIRKMIVLFIFLGFFLLFKSKHDIFSIFLIGFIVICELYIIIYNSLNNMLPLYMIFKLEYVYTTVNVILFIISINIAKYTKIMSYGLLFSVVLFIISLINVFTEVSYSNTPVVFYILYITIIISNVIVATGAYKKIKQYS